MIDQMVKDRPAEGHASLLTEALKNLFELAYGGMVYFYFIANTT